MKKIMALMLALVMVMSFAACGSSAPAPTEAANAANVPATEKAPENAAAPEDDVKLTLWTFPLGDWGNEDGTSKLISAFEAANPGIKVTVEYLDYQSGDDQVNTAIEGHATPDLILEGPERLVANWGEKGLMVDLSDMWDDTDKKEVLPGCLNACFNAEGKCYEYPVFSVAHCMAINYDAFVEAGADQYVDLETRTWTTEQFQEAVKALYAKYNTTVAAVFCGGQGGDQGTRVLINNLYGGNFTDAAHTKYTANSPENIKALELLKSMDGIYFDPAIVGGDEANLLRQGVLKMAFCWNASMHLDANNSEPGKTLDGQRIECMNFPSQDGKPVLGGGIWGFGIFDNGDQAKIDAAKKFVKFFADGEGTKDAVIASKFFAARTAVDGEDLSGMWGDNEFLNNYNKTIMPNLGDYYQVTRNWPVARTAWWNMLQRIGAGGNVADEVAAFDAEANA